MTQYRTFLGPKSGVFGYFLDFESLHFSDFVYNDKLWVGVD